MTAAVSQVTVLTGAQAAAAPSDAETMSYLASLPVELIIRIMRFLSIRDRIRFSQVCSRFHDVYYNQAVGAYAVELELNSLRTGPSNSFTTSERLQRVREYRDGWKTLQWKEETTLDLTEHTILRLHGSVLGRCEAETADSRFEFLQVPSPSRNIVKEEWSVELPGVRPFDFEIDTLQNLLVAMERVASSGHDISFLRLHFRTLDTGARHPSAAAATVDLRPRRPLTSEWYLHQTSVCDEHIGIMLVDEVDDGQVEFWLWDWKKGKFMMNLYSGYHDKAEGFTFLYPGRLLLPMVVPAEDSLHGTLGFLVVFDCSHPCEGRIKFALAMCSYGIGMFQLPEPAPGNHYARILMGSSSCSSQPAHPNPQSHLDNDVPFYADAHGRLLVFDITVLDIQTRGVMGHTLLVPSCALERRMRRAGEQRGLRALYQWFTWVPNARLTLSVLLQSHTSVFQRRCVAPEFTAEDADSKVVALYEINSALCMRREVFEAPETAPQYSFEPYVDTDLNSWMDHVQTKMPYRKFVSDIDAWKNSDLHLGEDCLIIRCQDTHKCRILSF